MSSLWTCVSGLNDSVVQHGGILDFIQKNQDDVHSRMKNLNSSVNQVLKELQSISEHDLTGELDSAVFYFVLFFFIVAYFTVSVCCVPQCVVFFNVLCSSACSSMSSKRYCC